MVCLCVCCFVLPNNFRWSFCCHPRNPDLATRCTSKASRFQYVSLFYIFTTYIFWRGSPISNAPLRSIRPLLRQLLFAQHSKINTMAFSASRQPSVLHFSRKPSAILLFILTFLVFIIFKIARCSQMPVTLITAGPAAPSKTFPSNPVHPLRALFRWSVASYRRFSKHFSISCAILAQEQKGERRIELDCVVGHACEIRACQHPVHNVHTVPTHGGTSHRTCWIYTRRSTTFSDITATATLVFYF